MKKEQIVVGTVLVAKHHDSHWNTNYDGDVRKGELFTVQSLNPTKLKSHRDARIVQINHHGFLKLHGPVTRIHQAKSTKRELEKEQLANSALAEQLRLSQENLDKLNKRHHVLTAYQSDEDAMVDFVAKALDKKSNKKDIAKLITEFGLQIS